MKRYCIALALIASTFAACKKDSNEPTVVTYSLPATATAKWQGHLATGYFNEGTIGVESNNLTLRDGRVTGGAFRMRLSSIRNLNLPTDSLKDMLVHHLQSADFFNMALHPELSFTITNVSARENAADSANYTVTGDLTLLGKSLPITFPAKIASTANDVTIAAAIKVDRTRWGITYASATDLPDEHHILNDISIDLQLKAQRN